MTENVVKFFIVAVWGALFVGGCIYALMIYVAFMSEAGFIGGIVCTIIFFVGICNVINILKRM